jgi:hypothetical protein
MTASRIRHRLTTVASRAVLHLQVNMVLQQQKNTLEHLVVPAAQTQKQIKKRTETQANKQQQ